MFDFHEKRKIRKFLYSKIVIVLLILVAGALAKSVYERYMVEREMAAKLEERVEELEVLKERAAVLESDVAHLENERGIEEELRSRFDVVKEGEKVVIILDDPKETTEKSESAPGDSAEVPTVSFFEMLKFW